MITVVIPSIPPRRALLRRALASVEKQTLQPADVIVALDTDHEGAAVTRQRGVEAAKTDWVAFLDDDDEFLPNHLRACYLMAERTNADLVYPWFTVAGGRDPLSLRGKSPMGQPFDDFARQEIIERNNFIPVTVLARRDTILLAGGFSAEERCEDWGLWRRMLLNHAKFVHCPQRTWIWHHHGRNTSGLPGNW